MVVAEAGSASGTPAVSVHARVLVGDVTVTDLAYALPSGRRVAAFLVWRPVQRRRPAAGVLLAHWGPGGRQVLLDEAIGLARAGTRVLVPETPAPTGSGEQAFADSLATAAATQLSGLSVLVEVAGADPGRLGVVAEGVATLPALSAARDPRIRALVLDGFGDVHRLGSAPARWEGGPGRRLLVQQRTAADGAGEAARATYAAAARPRSWRAYDHDAPIEQVRHDRALFLDLALRPGGPVPLLSRGAALVRDPDWWLRDRTTGERSVTPEATTPLLLWQLLVAARMLGLAPGREPAVRRADLALGGMWAVDELLRGSTPARRAVGAGVLGVQAVRAAAVRRRG